MLKFKSFKLFYFIQALLKYFPFKFGIYLRRFLYRPFFYKLGEGVIIHDNVLFKFPSDISLNNNVHIAQNTIFVGGGGLEIGNDVLIGAGTKIITSSHKFDNTNKSIIHQGLTFKPIKIGDDVWFGFNVVVLGGVEIGNGVIVGANSVVNKNIPDFYIVAGAPAKLIKKRT